MTTTVRGSDGANIKSTVPSHGQAAIHTCCVQTSCGSIFKTSKKHWHPKTTIAVYALCVYRQIYCTCWVFLERLLLVYFSLKLSDIFCWDILVTETFRSFVSQL